MTYHTLAPSGIVLRDSSFMQAGQLGQLAVSQEQQWSVYLQALALFGVEDWLQEHHCPLPTNSQDCTTLKPAAANLLTAVCNLRVGDFKLCLIPTGSLGDRWVDIPRAAVELPEFCAHFYLLVEVLEDCGSVQVMGVIPRDRLLQNCRQASVQVEENWTYLCPVEWFEDYDSNDLLLWLQAADARQLPLPDAPLRTVAAQLRQQLQPLQPQLARQPIWQVLDWERAVPLMVDPNWRDWLYAVASGETNPVQPADPEQAMAEAENSNPSQLRDLTVNVGVWLQDRMDEIAQELAWVLLPPLSAEMRTIEEDVDSIIGELERDGLRIPTHARGAYRTLQWEDYSLRLYAVTWPHLSSDNVPEWTLLLVLGPQPGCILPPATRLLVRDESQLLVEQTSSALGEETYLYARVVGNWDEKFWVTIDCQSMPGTDLHLPPFKFQPGTVQL